MHACMDPAPNHARSALTACQLPSLSLQENTILKGQLHKTNVMIRQYESALAWCGVDVHQLGLD